MKRPLTILGSTLMLCFFCVTLVFAQETLLKSAGEAKWLMYNKNGQLAGTITKTEDRGYRIENAAGAFGGKIWSNGNWNPPGAWRGRYVVITPEAAQLYLDALAALKSGSVL